MSKLNHFEKEIKKTVLNYLLEKNTLKNNVTVISELTIDSFSRRVDLVVLNDHKMIAYEIKSDADSLYRLPGQLNKYRKYFDKVVVVSTSKHINNILSTAPENVEVWEVEDSKVTVKKRGKVNKALAKEDYLDLLKVNDMRRLASIMKITISGSKNEVRRIIIDNISKVNRNDLKFFVLSTISKKFHLTSSAFLESIRMRRKVTLNDLSLLSPYVSTRKIHPFFEDSIIEKSK